MCKAQSFSYLMMNDFEVTENLKDVSFYQNKITIDTEEEIILSGHTSYPYKSCDSIQWSCVFSDVFNLAIPLNRIDELNKWEMNGYTFINKGKGIDYQGNDDGIFKIFASKEGENPNLYLYSKQKGLMAIVIFYETKSETYWAVDDRGLLQN